MQDLDANSWEFLEYKDPIVFKGYSSKHIADTIL